MPLSKLQLKPGINKESTTYANEGTFYDGNWVRFRSGYAEKIGGWLNQSFTATYKGVARTLFNWVTLASDNLLAIGTGQKYYVERGGTYYDITPVRAGPTTLGASPLATTNGSKLVTVTASAHGAGIGTFVTITSTSAVGGLTISGEYEIISVPTSNSFTIAATSAATSSATGGGTVTVTYDINAGNSASAAVSGGWGAGGWGTGGWGVGVGSVTTAALRLWTQCTAGENLVFAPRGGDIYYWDVDTSTWPRGKTLESVANTMAKVSSTGTSGGAGTNITLNNVAGIDIGSVVISGTAIATPGTDYVTAIDFNTNTVTLSASTTGAASGSYVFSYVGRAVPNQTNYVIAAEISKITVALGANPYAPGDFTTTFDPMLIRWSDQDNVFEWVPAVTNQAGEQRLNIGSYLVCGHNTRQEILVWTDAAIYSMQYIGPPYVFGFNLLSDNISIASPNAAVTTNNMTFWMGVDKFYLYTGRVETLPCSLRQFVFGNINRDELLQVTSGSNEGYNEVWWFYPTEGSKVNNRYVIYNYLEQVWYYGDINRTSWLDSPLRQYPLGAFSIQTSYLGDDLSGTVVDNGTLTIQLLNASSYPSTGTVIIDSEQITYTGVTGTALTGCTRGANGTTIASHKAYTPVTLSIPNQVMFHEYGLDDQSNDTPLPIYAYISSADFDIGDGHNFGYVWRILPDLTFFGSTTTSPDVPKVNMTVQARVNSGSNYGSDGNPTVYRTATYPVEQYTGQVYVRVRGRQMRFKIESSDLGVAWQLGAMRIDIRPDGRRA